MVFLLLRSCNKVNNTKLAYFPVPGLINDFSYHIDVKKSLT